MPDDLMGVFVWRAAHINPESALVEFGTGRGVSTSWLADRWSGPIFTIDGYTGLPESSREVPEYWHKGAYRFDKSLVLEELAKYKHITSIVSLITDLSSPDTYGIGPISGLNIDTDIYESARDALRWIISCSWERIAIRFDDWGPPIPPFTYHERAAFSEWLEEHHLQVCFEEAGEYSGESWCSVFEVMR